jgi:hypothetical protein
MCTNLQEIESNTTIVILDGGVESMGELELNITYLSLKIFHNSAGRIILVRTEQPPLRSRKRPSAAVQGREWRSVK